MYPRFLRLRCSLLVVAAGLISSGCRADAGPVPVMVGGEAGLDACALGTVTADGAMVRAGPDAGAAEVDQLAPGTRVWLCDRAEGWIGVVYGEDPRDCDLASPEPGRRAYDGPCASGWIGQRHVELMAG